MIIKNYFESARFVLQWTKILYKIYRIGSVARFFFSQRIVFPSFLLSFFPFRSVWHSPRSYDSFFWGTVKIFWKFEFVAPSLSLILVLRVRGSWHLSGGQGESSGTNQALLFRGHTHTHHTYVIKLVICDNFYDPKIVVIVAGRLFRFYFVNPWFQKGCTYSGGKLFRFKSWKELINNNEFENLCLIYKVKICNSKVKINTHKKKFIFSLQYSYWP